MNEHEANFAKYIVVGVVVFLLGGIGSCTLNDHMTDSKFKSMIDNGADPIETACAFYRDKRNCMIAADSLGKIMAMEYE